MIFSVSFAVIYQKSLIQMKKKVIALAGVIALLASSCSPRYATCPTYAQQKEVKQETLKPQAAVVTARK